MSLVQCMGGWCGPRESCAHYLAAPTPGREPADRLCGTCAEPVLWKPQQRSQPPAAPKPEAVPA